MPLFRNSVIAEPSATDNALVRWDGTTGQEVQDSGDTLTDAGVLTLPDSTSQVIVAGSGTSLTFQGVTLSPKQILNTANALQPNLAMVREDGTTATAAPTFNFFRARNSGVVNDGDTLGIFSAVGHDSVDYAAAAQIDIQVSDPSVGSNKMGGKIRMLTSPAGSQTPALVFSITQNKRALLNTDSFLQFTASTVLVTPEAGVGEYDGTVLYFSNSAFKRGVVPSEGIIALTATNTLASSTAMQSLFDSVGAGALSVVVASYKFECLLSMSAMSGTSGNLQFSIKGGGSATIASARYMTNGIDNVINTANANSGSMSNNETSAQPVVIGAASTEFQMHTTGIFRVSAAGTIIPSCALTNGAPAVVAVDSYFRCWPFGSDTVQTVGQWS